MLMLDVLSDTAAACHHKDLGEFTSVMIHLDHIAVTLAKQIRGINNWSV